MTKRSFSPQFHLVQRTQLCVSCTASQPFFNKPSRLAGPVAYLPMMDMRLPVRIEAKDDDLLLLFEKELRARSFEVIAKCNEKRSDPPGTFSAFLEIPSDLELLEPVRNYLAKRLVIVWSLPEESCKVIGLALQEALINAIKHGNHSDPSRRVQLTVEITADDATFTVEDEGGGFGDPPNPLDPVNLYKSSGRGVLLIKSIMDETRYNPQGNRLTMTKRRSSMIGVG